CTTGLDLVKLQIHVARGGHLEGEPPRTTGHAIEVRLNAEDPDNGFAPAPGLIERFRILTGPGVRVDTGVAEGDAVASEFDSMIAKIIAYGQNRKEALSRLQRALRGSVVVIKGGASNKAFLLELLNHRDVRRGEVHIGWLDQLAATGDHISRRHADVALVQAAIEAYDAQLAIDQTQFYASAVRGRPHVRGEVGRTTELRYRGHSYSAKAYRLGPQQYRVEVNGSRIKSHLDRLAVLEAMKMEMQVVAPFSGKVRQVMTMRNVQVDTGAPLLQIEPDAGGDTVAAGERVVFGASRGSDGNEEAIQPSCRQSLEEVRQFMLGFDVD